MLVEQKGYQGRQTMFGNVVKPAVAELLTLGTPTVSPNQQVVSILGSCSHGLTGVVQGLWTLIPWAQVPGYQTSRHKHISEVIQPTCSAHAAREDLPNKIVSDSSESSEILARAPAFL